MPEMSFFFIWNVVICVDDLITSTSLLNTKEINKRCCFYLCAVNWIDGIVLLQLLSGYSDFSLSFKIIQLSKSDVMKTQEIRLSQIDITSVNLYHKTILSRTLKTDDSIFLHFFAFHLLPNRFGSRIAGQRYANSKRISNHRMQTIRKQRVVRRAHHQHCRHHVVVQTAPTQSPTTIRKHPVREWRRELPQKVLPHHHRWNMLTVRTTRHRTTIN